MKTPQIPETNRRVCDGVYLYPMFFGMTDNEIPEVPDCASWATSATKVYSASIRTGFIAYKTEPESNGFYLNRIASSLTSLTYGDYSEWSWWGHMQIVDMLTAKPYTDPTSWIGAYTEVQTAKWSAIIDGFANCPYIDITNPNAGAYVFFMMLDPYLGTCQTRLVSPRCTSRRASSGLLRASLLLYDNGCARDDVLLRLPWG